MQLADSPGARGFLVDWFEALLTDEGGAPGTGSSTEEELDLGNDEDWFNSTKIVALVDALGNLVRFVLRRPDAPLPAAGDKP